MDMTTIAPGQRLLAEKYARTVAAVRENLEAIARLVADDFPAPDDTTAITRYHVDAMNDLNGQLAALVWGYERK